MSKFWFIWPLRHYWWTASIDRWLINTVLFSLGYRYQFVRYWEKCIVILQKGFAVHQLWHFDIFCTKHFENQTEVLAGFETGLHAFVQTVSSCFIICNRHNFTCSAVNICRKGKNKHRVFEISPRTMFGDFYDSVPLSVWISYFMSLLPLAAEVDSSVARVKWLTAFQGQRSFYSQVPCLRFCYFLCSYKDFSLQRP